MRRIFIVGIFLVIFSAAVYFLLSEKFEVASLPLEQAQEIEQSAEPATTDQQLDKESVMPTPAVKDEEISEPMADALARVTKKPFGIKISPNNSPVSPEKFAGYHTGVDFETTIDEQNIEVSIYAICSGKLLLKKQATGYGGVAVQSCEINKQAVTVVYGHLKLLSVSAQVDQDLKAGDQLGVLGQGYSPETDGERKHLHLGIHLGQSLVLLGYVPKPEQLSAWLDPLLWLGQ